MQLEISPGGRPIDAWQREMQRRPDFASGWIAPR